MIRIQEEKQVSLEEWDYIWRMFSTEQRRLEELKGREFELQGIEEQNKLTRNSQNEIVRAKNQQEGRFNPSGKVYMRQQRSVTAFVPRSTVHTHCNPWRILGVN